MLVQGVDMSLKEQRTTVVSAKGGITVPKAMRNRLRWAPGTELIVENTPDGVLLRASPILLRMRGGSLAAK